MARVRELTNGAAEGRSARDPSPIPEPAADAAPIRLADLPRRPILAIALIATLALLLAHAGRYAFLTDDAYISFRYARNLADGHGLVFNPGAERVEGYSNFLWTVVLAAASAAGVPPERVATPLSLLATVALWALVVAYALRHPPPARHAWLIVVPPLLLALTRSVAVWSTSGLETRWFETLVVAGALRLLVEIGKARRGERHRPFAMLALGLAALTRPDGMMIAACAWAVKLGAVVLDRAERRDEVGEGAFAARSDSAGSATPRDAATPLVRRLLPWAPIDLGVLAALIGGHLAFRLAYYGEWLPNTYYAKVDGRLWWSAGIAYARAFALEYAVVLWLPLLAWGIVYHRRRGSWQVPALFAAIVLPHLLYVVAIGGDHFEYRPLNLYFPLAFVLMYDGAREWLARPRGAVALAVWLPLVAWGLWHLPDRTRREFPPRYLSGFPGLSNPATLGRRYMDPRYDPVYRLPVLNVVGRQYHADLLRLTRNFIAIRQEEHRLFLATAIVQGQRLGQLVEAGTLPRDVRIAMSCVGAIPYVSGIWTLDRLGLTDAHVAHSPFVARRFLAHDKGATLEYARERDVDLWTSDHVHTVLGADAANVFAAVSGALAQGDSVYAAPIGGGDYVLAFLPKGAVDAARRMPALSFRWCGDPALVQELLTQAMARTLAAVEADPAGYEKRRHLAFLFVLSRQPEEAGIRYEELVREEPGDAEAWENLGLCYEQLGWHTKALAATEQALALASEYQDTSSVVRLEQRARSWSAR